MANALLSTIAMIIQHISSLVKVGSTIKAMVGFCPILKNMYVTLNLCNQGIHEFPEHV